LIFNPVRIGSEQPLELLGYHLAGGRRYTRIPPLPQGRVRSRTTGLFFWSDPDARRIEIFDQATGARLLTDDEEKARADAEKARADAEKARADAAEAQVRELKALLGRRD
jgi:hypothetical protein